MKDEETKKCYVLFASKTMERKVITIDVGKMKCKDAMKLITKNQNHYEPNFVSYEIIEIIVNTLRYFSYLW